MFKLTTRSLAHYLPEITDTLRTSSIKMHTVAKAMWNAAALAESEKYEIVEGNVYFPPESIKRVYFRDSTTEYECPGRGHSNW